MKELVAIVIGVTVLGLSAFVSAPIDNAVRDAMMAFISPFTKPAQDIVVVAISESTLASFPYRSPIDRCLLAKTIETIDAARPKAIGIDLLFDQPTEQDKDNDLQRAIMAAVAPIILATASEREGLTDQQVAYVSEFAPKASRGLAVLSHDRSDGVVRSAFWGRMGVEGWTPSFAVALAISSGLPVPSQHSGQVYYRDGTGTLYQFPVYPAESINLIPPGWLEGKYVLIGSILPGEDRHPTPFSNFGDPGAGNMPGVLIHAHSLASIIANDGITTPGWLIQTLPYLAVALLCLWIAWAPLPIMIKPVLIAALLALIWIAAAVAFSQSGILLPVATPTMAIVGLCTIVAILAWRRDNQDREFIREAFSKYVNPATVSEIVKNPSALKLGGEERYITSVFTDIEGFTSLSESTSPEHLAGLLNEYLDQVCDLFLKHGATIDKVVGDAVVGFFGAPAPQDDQAERAIRLTLELCGLSSRMRVAKEKGEHLIGVTRIGIHSGPALVGNFGGRRFFNYSAIGDTVNIASRLESANKYLRTKNCISAAAAEKSSGFLLRPIGQVYLRGKQNPIGALEVSDSNEENRRMFADYMRAFDMLRSKSADSIAAFAQLSEKYPQDGLIAFHRARLQDGSMGTDIYLGG